MSKVAVNYVYNISTLYRSKIKTQRPQSSPTHIGRRGSRNCIIRRRLTQQTIKPGCVWTLLTALYGDSFCGVLSNTCRRHNYHHRFRNTPRSSGILVRSCLQIISIRYMDMYIMYNWVNWFTEGGSIDGGWIGNKEREREKERSGSTL